MEASSKILSAWPREDTDLKAAFGAWMTRAGRLARPPTVTTAIVSANPGYLVDFEATAILPLVGLATPLKSFTYRAHEVSVVGKYPFRLDVTT